MKTIQEIEEILGSVEYKGWGFRTTPAGDGCLFSLVFPAIDSSTGVVTQQFSRKWYISPHSTHSEIVQTYLKAVLTAEEHETREQFLYKGQAIFKPHYDVNDLVELAANSEDVRS